MEVLPLSQCTRELDFSPRQPWPKPLPPVAWNFKLIAGFDREEGSVLHYSGPDPLQLYQLTRACHSHLGLGEFARLHHCFKMAGLVAPELFETLGYRFDETLIQLLEKIVGLPSAFGEWVDHRQVAARELSVLVALDALAPIENVTSEIANRQLSRSFGIKVLELAGELVAMGRPLPTPPPMDKEGRQWAEDLSRARHPRAAAADDHHKKMLDQTPWPAHVRAEWKRQGDEAQLEVRFTVRSEKEWTRRLEELEAVTAALGQNSPWRN